MNSLYVMILYYLDSIKMYLENVIVLLDCFYTNYL